MDTIWKFGDMCVREDLEFCRRPFTGNSCRSWGDRNAGTVISGLARLESTHEHLHGNRVPDPQPAFLRRVTNTLFPRFYNLFLCISMHMRRVCLTPVKIRSQRIPGTGVLADCELPCWCRQAISPALLLKERNFISSIFTTWM